MLWFMRNFQAPTQTMYKRKAKDFRQRSYQVEFKRFIIWVTHAILLCVISAFIKCYSSIIKHSLYILNLLFFIYLPTQKIKSEISMCYANEIIQKTSMQRIHFGELFKSISCWIILLWFVVISSRMQMKWLTVGQL